IADIEGVAFKDDIFELNVKDGDKFLWLFRVGWNYGLFFDFSEELKTDSLFKELGESYRIIQFFDLYSYFSQSNNFQKLQARGWFPFIQLIGGDFEQLIAAPDTDLPKVESAIANKFNKQILDQITQKWW